jgi:mRNA interferase MazF
MTGYVPEAGDVIWTDFSPQAGRERAGRRPAVVLSPAKYNGRTGLAICCPLATRIKGYPFEVALAGDPASVALSDHVKNLDWRARGATLKGRVTAIELAAIKGKLAALIG